MIKRREKSCSVSVCGDRPTSNTLRGLKECLCCNFIDRLPPVESRKCWMALQSVFCHQCHLSGPIIFFCIYNSIDFWLSYFLHPMRAKVSVAFLCFWFSFVVIFSVNAHPNIVQLEHTKRTEQQHDVTFLYYVFTTHFQKS